MNPETLDKLNFEGPFFERIQTSLEEKYTQQRLEAELKARELERERKNVEEHLENVGVMLYKSQEDLTRERILLDAVSRDVLLAEDELEQLKSQLHASEMELEAKLSDKQDKEKTVELLRIEMERVASQIVQGSLTQSSLSSDQAILNGVTAKSKRSLASLEVTQNNLDTASLVLEEKIAAVESDMEYIRSEISFQKSHSADLSAKISEWVSILSHLESDKKALTTNQSSLDSSLNRRALTIHEMMGMISESMPIRIEMENEMKGLVKEIQIGEEKFNEQLMELMRRVDGRRMRVVEIREEALADSALVEAELEVFNNKIRSVDAEISAVKETITTGQRAMTEIEAEKSDILHNTREVREISLSLIAEKSILSTALADRIKEYRSMAEYSNTREEELVRLMKQLDKMESERKYEQSHLDTVTDQLAEDENDLTRILQRKEKIEKSVERANTLVERKRVDLHKLEAELTLKEGKKRTGEAVGEQSSEFALSLAGKVASTERKIAESIALCEETKNEWVEKQMQVQKCKKEMAEVHALIADSRIRLTVLRNKLTRKSTEIEKSKTDISELQKTISKNETVYNKLTGLMDAVTGKINSFTTAIQLSNTQSSSSGLDSSCIEKLNAQKDSIEAEIADSLIQLENVNHQRALLETNIGVRLELLKSNASQTVAESNAAMKSTLRQLQIQLTRINKEKYKTQKTILSIISADKAVGSNERRPFRKVSLASRSTQAATLSTTSIACAPVPGFVSGGKNLRLGEIKTLFEEISDEQFKPVPILDIGSESLKTIGSRVNEKLHYLSTLKTEQYAAGIQELKQLAQFIMYIGDGVDK